MKIEIDLDNLGFTYDEDGDPSRTATLRDAIVQAAAHKLALEQNHEVRSDLRHLATNIVTQRIASTVDEVLREPIQRTSPWGEHRGEPVTVKDMVREELHQFMSRPPRDRYSFDRSKPNSLAELVQESTRTMLTGELKKTVEQAKENVHNTVTDAALKAAVEAISKGNR